MAGEPGMFKILKPRARIHSTDIQAAALLGVATTTTALYLVQVMRCRTVLVYIRSVDAITNQCETLTFPLTSANVCTFEIDGDVELMKPK